MATAFLPVNRGAVTDGAEDVAGVEALAAEGVEAGAVEVAEELVEVVEAVAGVGAAAGAVVVSSCFLR